MKDLLCLLGFLVQFGISLGTERCRGVSESWPWVKCEYKCCEEYPYHYCCGFWTDAAFIGNFIGVVMFISLFLCVCKCSKKTEMSDRFIEPAMSIRSQIIEGQVKAIWIYWKLAVLKGIWASTLIALGIAAFVKRAVVAFFKQNSNVTGSKYQRHESSNQYFDSPYLIGFCGVMFLALAALCRHIAVRAPGVNSDVKRRELQFAIYSQALLEKLLMTVSLISSIINVKVYFAGENQDLFTMRNLEQAIFVLTFFISLFITVSSLCLRRMYDSCLQDDPRTSNQNSNDDKIRHLEEVNRLLQQQRELQRQLNSQQQQNPGFGGFDGLRFHHPSPPPYDYPLEPSAPPPSYNSVKKEQ